MARGPLLWHDLVVNAPIIETLSGAPPPRDAVWALAGEYRPFVLESAAPPGRYSFAGANPFLTVFLRGECLEEIRCFLDSWTVPREEVPTPFPAGAVGWFAFESGLPRASLSFYDTVATWDQETGEALVCSTGLPSEDEVAMERGRERAASLAAHLTGETSSQGAFPRLLSPLRSDLSRDEFLRQAEKVRASVSAGNVEGAQVWQRFSVETQEPGHVIYGRLVRAAPSPFAAWLNAGEEGEWVAASRERVLAATGTAPEILGRIREALPNWGAAIGYFSFTGRADFATADRALYMEGGRVSFRAGARIDAATDPAEAYDASMSEAKILAAALGFKM